MSDDSIPPQKPSLPDDEDLQRRFERIREDLKGMDLPDLPPDDVERLQAKSELPTPAHDDIDEKLRLLQDKVKRTQGQYVTAVNKPSKKDIEESNRNSRGLAFGLTIAYLIMGMPLACAAIGWIIDWRLGTEMGKGIGCLIGATIGVIIAIRMINENAANEQ